MRVIQAGLRRGVQMRLMVWRPQVGQGSLRTAMTCSRFTLSRPSLQEATKEVASHRVVETSIPFEQTAPFPAKDFCEFECWEGG
jgi:hypothetical protein